MPWDTTFDEAKKAYFILNSTQDFQQPLLMLQLIRAANRLVGYTDLDGVVRLGRTVSAMFGGVFVLSAMLLARQIFGMAGALPVGVLTAVAPLTVVHAHFFKEDIFVAPMLLFSLLTLARLCEAPALHRSLAFGAAAGLAASAKYIGVIVIPLAFVFPIVYFRCASIAYFKFLAASILVAVAVFLGVNCNLFYNFTFFVMGFSSEVTHALTRHVTYFPGWLSGFSWEWSNALLPGLQPLFAFAGAGAAIVILAQWRQAPPTVRLVLLFTVIWYLVHELSPMKPVIGSARHMTVMVGTCAILVVYAACRLVDTFRIPGKQIVVPAIALVLAVPCIWQSVRLARSVPYDTQIVAKALATRISGSVIWPAFDHLASQHMAEYPSLTDAAGLRNLMNLYDFIVIWEPVAQHILEANRLGNQPLDVREAADLLTAIIERPALLITSKIGRFSYRNVPIRIVALNGRPEQLAAVVTLRGDWPAQEVTLTYISGSE